jgi:pimeloyl-ACP methyl ester carboxylesterase
VARDVESLRLALGEAQLSFVGLSYGTYIGLLWAEQFPASVRSLVLDGVVDPQETGTGTSLDQLQAIDATFEAIAAACAADPSCPATADGGVVPAYDRLAEGLEGGSGTAAGVGPTQLTYAVFMATYGSEHWPSLWAALHDGLAGDLSGVAALAASFTGLVAYAPFAVITCLDSPHPATIRSWRGDAAQAALRSPRFGAALANELLPCAYLPSSGLLPHRIAAPGTPPILVVGSTGDVATPYEQAVRVARNLDHGVLLTVDEPGHVAIGGSECATAAVTRYLVEGTVPDRGADC